MDEQTFYNLAKSMNQNLSDDLILNSYQKAIDNSLPQEEREESKKGILFSNVLSTVQSPFRGIGEGIGNIIAQPFVNRQQQEVQAQGENLTQQLLQRLNQARQAGNQSEIDRYTRALQWVDTGAGITDEFAQNLPSNREVIGSALQTAGIIGGFGAGGATGSLARQAGIGAAQEAGAGAIVGLGSGLSDPNATAGDIARDTLMGAGLGAVVGAGIPVAIAGAGSVARAGSRLSEYLNRAPQNVKTSGGNIKESISNVINRANQPITNAFEQAQSRGFSPQQARLFSDMTAQDRKVAKEIFDLREGVSTGAISDNKMSVDFAIKPLKEKLNTLYTKQKQLGKKVDDVAQSLKGETVDLKPFRDSIRQLVNDYNITGKKGNWNFSNSDFALTEAVQKEISKALDFVYSTKSNAYDVHRIKKTLDTLINPTKQGEGLAGQAKTLVQRLRSTTDNFLDNTFEGYKLANDEYSTLRNVLENTEDIFGDLSESRLSAKVRTLLSNSPNRSAVTDALTQIEEIGKLYGLPEGVNLRSLGRFMEELDSIFGTEAVTGLKGQVEGGVKGVQAVTSALRKDGLLGAAGTFAGDIIETVAGQTDTARREFIRSLLNQ